jgi:anti-sigma regulatory factor (Ser/Thr protein kinase)
MTSCFRFASLADSQAPSVSCGAFRAWLAGEPRWPAEEIDTLVVAVGEAVRNVVEHAYSHNDSGSVTITAGLVSHPYGRTQAIIVIRDQGLWRGVHASAVHHPRGLRLMRGCTESLKIDRAFDGTRVTMLSRPVQLSAPT